MAKKNKPKKGKGALAVLSLAGLVMTGIAVSRHMRRKAQERELETLYCANPKDITIVENPS